MHSRAIPVNHDNHNEITIRDIPGYMGVDMMGLDLKCRQIQTGYLANGEYRSGIIWARFGD